MLRRLSYGALAVLAASATMAYGQSHAARVVTAADAHNAPKTVESHRVSTNGTRLVRVVRRPIVQPAAVVSRALSEQPVHEHLIEVQVGHTEIYLDPNVDYLRQSPHSTMQPNYLTAALQRHAKLTKGKVRHVFGSQHPQARRMPKPLMVIHKPDYLKNRPNAQPKRLTPMPTVPKAPKHQEQENRIQKTLAKAPNTL